MAAATAGLLQKQGEWVKTTCFMCWNTCGIEVHVVDGVADQIRGQPDCPQNWGKTCAKGNSGHMSLYNPDRVLKPMKRTNPRKGLGVDPGWQEISWDEAMQILADKLARIRAEDPRKLVISTFDTRGQSGVFWGAWAAAFGTPNQWGGGSQYYCGNGFHPVTYLTHGTWFAEPDLRYCRFLITFGTQNGFVSNHLPMDLAHKMADARMEGLKLVVVDPVGINSGSKATEWVPIRPGTDAALALAMANVMVNEEGIYDREFLVRYTNGPYLIGEDGRYLRDPMTRKPLVWDSARQRACPFDDAEVGEMALEGRFEVNGTAAPTAFTLLKEHLRKYTPEKMSEVTTIPAQTIRRLGREFARTAQVGSTITVNGVTLPYRPVCANWYRGAIAHKHAMLNGLAIELLNVLVGAIDVPGGHLGNNPVSHTPPLRWSPSASPDGLLVPEGYARRRKPPYPATRVRRPERLDLLDLCPVAPYGGPLATEGILHPEKYGIPYQPEMLILARSNLLWTTANPEQMAEAVRRFDFVVAFCVEMNETAEFADLVLPDTHYLERLDAFPNEPTEFVGAGLGYWYWMVRQPVVRPQGEARHWVEVLYELADRLGFLDDVYALLNATLELKEPFRLEPGQRYTWDEMADRWMKSWFGPEKGLDHFKKEGYVITGEKSVQEAYPRPFLKPRIPVYFEYLLDAGEEVRRVTSELGIRWDTSDYQALVDWKPCPSFHKTRPGYDLLVVNFKLPIHGLGYTTHNAFLADLSEKNPYAYYVLLNTATARKMGIRDGDPVRVESEAGFAVEGVAKLTECIHPEVVGTAGCFGRRSKGLNRSYGRGVHFNTLLPQDVDRVDTLSCALDSCIRVKVTRI